MLGEDRKQEEIAEGVIDSTSEVWSPPLVGNLLIGRPRMVKGRWSRNKLA